MDTDRSLSGFRVAVTGGTSGLGLALVRALSEAGASTAFVARTPQSVARVAAETGTVGIVGDVGSKSDVYPIALEITGNLGGLDVLINNASTLGPAPLRLLSDTACEDLEAALDVNLVGPFRLTKALYGALVSSARQGINACVVNISSDAAISAYPQWGAYGASKAALRHLSAIWHEESREVGVGFHSVDPGDMDTPLHALADPGADPASLKRPEVAAAEILDRLRTILGGEPARGLTA